MLLGAVFSTRDQWWQEETPIPDAVIDRMARELEVGRWLTRFALYEDEPVADHKFKKIKEAFERIPGAEVWGEKHAPEDIAAARAPRRAHPGRRAEPRVEPDDRLVRGRGGRPHRLLAGGAADGPDAGALRDLLRGLVEKEAGLDYIAALIPTNARSFVHITLVIFDTKDEAQARRAYDTSKLLVREAAKAGYGEYRAHLDFMDLAAEQYSFSNHAYMRFNETIKDALDPNGILAPGKSGIWPKAMREARAREANGR